MIWWEVSVENFFLEKARKSHRNGDKKLGTSLKKLIAQEQFSSLGTST